LEEYYFINFGLPLRQICIYLNNINVINKQVVLEIESVYTANAFPVGTDFYIGAGSETKPLVYLYDLKTRETRQVTGSPGGLMSFVPVPGKPGLFVSIMGLFPPFIGGEAGLFLHKRTNGDWQTNRALHLPFAHRCEILNRGGRNFLFAATVSTFKANPQDWSNPGELHLIDLDNNPEDKWASRVIPGKITKNHGMTRARINGKETLCISGQEGMFFLDQVSGDEWVLQPMFEGEVSEMTFIDLDGDGQDEMVTIEPFHGETINVYKHTGNKWELRISDPLSFGHGLSSGIFQQDPVIVVGNRSGSLNLETISVLDLSKGEFERRVLEKDAGPTQTQVFSVEGQDYILSANQRKNEVALYS
jgi:hypothetical protein